MSVAPRIVVAAGGTGGHVFPGLAIAAEVQKRGGEVAWLGVGGMETKLAKARGLTVETIPFQSPRGISGWARLPGAVWRAVRFLRRLRPAAVLAMGGYPGGSRRLGGGALRNSIGDSRAKRPAPARPTFVFANWRGGLLSAFPTRCRAEMHLGNPAREEFFQLPSPEERFADDLESPPRRLLILGGSQGAESLTHRRAGSGVHAVAAAGHYASMRARQRRHCPKAIRRHWMQGRGCLSLPMTLRREWRRRMLSSAAPARPRWRSWRRRGRRRF